MAEQAGADATPPAIKTQIGPWQLGKTLGRGSSARVQAARHVVTGQIVAVKIMVKSTAHRTQAGSLATLDALDRASSNGAQRVPLAIERETGILKLIEHPNIVKLHDVWENYSEIFLVMEYVENGDLFTYLNRNGSMREAEAVRVFRQIMSAMEYTHSFHICHRDLKPENILLKADGQVKIADFGMAALHQTPGGLLQTSCGSPHYAAPEILKGQAYSGATADIWSMGVILYAMLAGRLPFDDGDLARMMQNVKSGTYFMPHWWSNDAKYFMRAILQVEPRKRLNITAMWTHPLVAKYDHLDDLCKNDGQPPGIHTELLQTPLNFGEIDQNVFRQVLSLWHEMSKETLTKKLASEEDNDQKRFYWLLHNYRERQLENLAPDPTHSACDHHLLQRPKSMTKVSTRQFAQSRANSRRRRVTTLTVVSSASNARVSAKMFPNRGPHKYSHLKVPVPTFKEKPAMDNFIGREDLKRLPLDYYDPKYLLSIGIKPPSPAPTVPLEPEVAQSFAETCDAAFESPLPSEHGYDHSVAESAPEVEKTIRVVHSPEVKAPKFPVLLTQEPERRLARPEARPWASEEELWQREDELLERSKDYGNLEAMSEEPERLPVFLTQEPERREAWPEACPWASEKERWQREGELLKRNKQALQEFGNLDAMNEELERLQQEMEKVEATLLTADSLTQELEACGGSALAPVQLKMKLVDLEMASTRADYLKREQDALEKAISEKHGFLLQELEEVSLGLKACSRQEVDRPIEPRQTFLARLFRVKPAKRYLCLTTSQRRARQEIAILLREWRRHGIEDIEVDKERNIIFARVGARNVLQLREASFACEIITVIEHGSRNQLSIIRFTQEWGAASSFYKVVDTMRNVFSSRNLIVADKRKAKMMIKTLIS